MAHEEIANKKDDAKKLHAMHHDPEHDPRHGAHDPHHNMQHHHHMQPIRKIEHAWPQELTGLMLLMKGLYTVPSFIIMACDTPENPNIFYKGIGLLMKIFLYILIADIAINAIIFFGRICPFFIISCLSLFLKNISVVMIFIAMFLQEEVNEHIAMFLYLCSIFIVDALFIHYLRHHLRTPDKCVKRNYEYDSEDI